ncbi:MAG: hypothetical protein IT378_17480 [Sandaracinaceae bacterium]|nr:hypothetical protein [Sandaracinaceae bacterium]
MTTPDLEDRLSRYHDGELPAEDARLLEQELERDGDLRAKLSGLEHLGDLIRMHAAAEDGAEDDAMWARIQAKLASSEGAQAQPAAPIAADAPVRPKLAVVQGARGRARLWIPVAATLAIAAAVLIAVWARPPASVGPTPETVARTEPQPGSEIVEVDFGYSTGAIFSVEGQEGEHYAVVWISDEKVADEAVQ